MRYTRPIILAFFALFALNAAWAQEVVDSTERKSFILEVLKAFSGDSLSTIYQDSVIPTRIPKVYHTLPLSSEAPIIKIPQSKQMQLKNGLKIIHVEDHSMPLVTFYIGISTARVFEGDKKGIADLTSQMLMAGAQERTKNQITDSLSNMGSQYLMTGNSFYVSGLKKYAYANFALFSDVLLRPSFPLQEYIPALNAMSDMMILNESNPSMILNRVYRALAFGANNPIGEFANADSFSKISLNDCVNFYHTYWRPNNAVLLVMGDISPSELLVLVNSRFRNWGSKELPKSAVTVSNDLPNTAVNFINDIYSPKSRIIISNLAEFDYNSPDVYPAMFINYLMGGDLLANIRKVLSPDKRTLPIDVFSLSPDPITGYMYLSTQAENECVVEVIKEKTKKLEYIRTIAIDSIRLEGVRQHLIGRMALSMDDKKAMASYGIAVENGVVKQEFIQEILRQIEKVSADDIMRVAQKYIKPSQFRIVVYGNARKAVPALELAGYNVLFYDSKAHKTPRPSLASAITTDIKAKDVLTRYFTAMGGYRSLKAILSLKQVFEIDLEGKKFEADILSRTPFYHQEILTYKNSIYLKKTFNGNMGYTKIERTRKDLSVAEVENGRLARSIFPLVDYDKAGFGMELDSIVPVRGLFTYKLRVTLPTKQIQNYYMSIDSGIPLRIENVTQLEVKEMDTKGKIIKYIPEKISSYTDYIEYTNIDGVRYPSLMEVRDENGGITWRAKITEPNANIPIKDFR